MVQMKIDERHVVPLNYDNIFHPKSVRVMKPVLFKVGELFCCLLGPDPKCGIFGYGNTMRAALWSWNLHFQEQLKKPTVDAKVMDYVYGSMVLEKLDLI